MNLHELYSNIIEAEKTVRSAKNDLEYFIYSILYDAYADKLNGPFKVFTDKDEMELYTYVHFQRSPSSSELEVLKDLGARALMSQSCVTSVSVTSYVMAGVTVIKYTVYLQE